MLYKKNLFQNKFYVLLDQALVALLNFGSVFLLSKLASISVFANFVLTYSYSNLIFILVTFFISAPVLVLLPKKDENDSSYPASLLALSIIFSLGLSFIGFWFVNQQVGNVGFWFFLGINFSMIVYDLFKKFIFAQTKISFVHTFISSVILVVVFFGMILCLKDSLSVNSILWVYILSFLLSTLFLFIIISSKGFLKQYSFIPSKSNFQKIGIVFKEHYTYSKWIIAAGVLFWGYSQGIFILADFIGVDELGISKMRTIQNLLGLFSVLLMSMESYFIPYFSRKVNNLHQTVKEFYAQYTIGLLVIFLLSIPIIYFAYSFFYEEKYGNGMIIMAILWVSQLIVVFTRPLSMALKAKEITYPLFKSHLVALLGLIFAGSFFIYLWKDTGMSIALFLVYFLSGLTVMYYYKKQIQLNE